MSTAGEGRRTALRGSSGRKPAPLRGNIERDSQIRFSLAAGMHPATAQNQGRSGPGSDESEAERQAGNRRPATSKTNEWLFPTAPEIPTQSAEANRGQKPPQKPRPVNFPSKRAPLSP